MFQYCQRFCIWLTNVNKGCLILGEKCWKNVLSWMEKIAALVSRLAATFYSTFGRILRNKLVFIRWPVLLTKIYVSSRGLTEIRRCRKVVWAFCSSKARTHSDKIARQQSKTSRIYIRNVNKTLSHNLAIVSWNISRDLMVVALTISFVFGNKFYRHRMRCYQPLIA